MDGIELAARFSYITNSLGFCGPKNSSRQFLQYIKNKKNQNIVKSSLINFEGLYPYLSAIAEKANKNFFDYDVVEAYWLGNELLDSFDDEDIVSIIKRLMQRGLPSSIGSNLIKNLPTGFVPHHNFNVFYVGVGNITGSVLPTLKNMESCRISSGKVLKVSKDNLLVKTALLKKDNDKFILKKDHKTIAFLPEMPPAIKIDDIVALHWNFACAILSEEQHKNLEKYNSKVLDIINNSNI